MFSSKGNISIAIFSFFLCCCSNFLVHSKVLFYQDGLPQEKFLATKDHMLYIEQCEIPGLSPSSFVVVCTDSHTSLAAVLNQ
jgi:hypothetical protein